VPEIEPNFRFHRPKSSRKVDLPWHERQKVKRKSLPVMEDKKHSPVHIADFYNKKRLKSSTEDQSSLP
jgi:hypothetical protein